MLVLLVLLLVVALLAVEIKNLFRSVLLLGLTGIVLGIIFFSMHANLVGVFQIAIYGGMTMVLVFLITMVGEKHE